MIEPVEIALTVNGESHRLTVEPRRLLVDVIRHDLGLHGTHVGCEQGVCGMCTVLVDGQPTKSCLLLAPQADGVSIQTVESLADGDRLHPLQAAFRETHALQCGYCTPAMLMTAYALGERVGGPIPAAEIKEELAGVLCRCTGYGSIVAAVARYLEAKAEAIR